VTLDSTVAIVMFAAGLIILALGLSLFAKSLSLALVTLIGGCTIAFLGAVSLVLSEPQDCVWEMAWPAAGLLAFLLFKYGPSSSASTLLRIALSGAMALLVAMYLTETNRRPFEGVIILPAFVFWFPLARYRPASHAKTWLRGGAYAAMLVYAVTACVAGSRGLACTKRGCFWVMSLLHFYTVQLPHPWDYYVTYQLMNYLLLGSLLLTLGCSVTCLGMWLRDAHNLKPLSAQKV
jgi:hypothetical protein